MQNYDFDFQLDDFMLYCRTNQLRPKTMASYEQTLRLFQRWLKEELQIENVNEVTEPIIRQYLDMLLFYFFQKSYHFISFKLRKICHFSVPFLVISQPDRISFCVPTIAV